MLEYLATHRISRIAETEWNELTRALAPVSESYLRRILRETGIPFDQPYAGIRQESFEALEESLLAMLEVYSRAKAAGDSALAQRCRRAVILAKDHARLAAKAGKGREQIKEEMIRWMLIWLESPEVFPAWVKLRKGVISTPSS